MRKATSIRQVNFHLPAPFLQSSVPAEFRRGRAELAKIKNYRALADKGLNVSDSTNMSQWLIIYHVESSLSDEFTAAFYDQYEVAGIGFWGQFIRGFSSVYKIFKRVDLKHQLCDLGLTSVLKTLADWGRLFVSWYSCKVGRVFVCLSSCKCQKCDQKVEVLQAL
ncbi:hypothetical protein J6590_103886 [Homalodisca vitripennis]|nr:hypothetical protein J6590_103886 [Homalodisca vitripennis]